MAASPSLILHHDIVTSVSAPDSLHPVACQVVRPVRTTTVHALIYRVCTGLAFGLGRADRAPMVSGFVGLST